MSSSSGWLPTLRQFRGWSLPNRATYLSFILGIVSLLITGYGVIPWFRGQPEAAPASGAENDIEEAQLARYAELGLPPAATRHLRHLFRNTATLPEARAILERMAASAKTRRQLDRINEFINATYCGEKRYRDGLEFLARITRDLPRSDQRYRFLFHDQIRGLANEEGAEAAEDAIDFYRRRLRRDELSRVWIAVPNAMMDDLREGRTVFDSPRLLHEEDRVYLEQLLEEGRSDPYIDHAFYFLGAYGDVVEQFPKSLIRDTALRAWTYAAFDCEEDPSACNLPLARARFGQLVTEYPEFEEEARARAGAQLAKAGWLTEAEAIACPRPALCERADMLEAALGTRRARYGKVIAWLGPRDWKLLRQRSDEAFAAFDESVQFARLHDYAAAREVLLANRAALARYGIPAPPLLRARLGAFQPLAKFSSARTAQEKFALGLAEAEAAYEVDSSELTTLFRERAVETFEQVEDLAPKSDLAAKSCYLRAATLRRLQNHHESFGVIEHFLGAHRSSPLYDDMLTEKGLYLRRVRDDDGAAAAVFAQVAQQFPKANAADNALTFLAEMRERQCRFSEAFAIYRRVASEYPYSRLGRAAAGSAQELVPVVRLRRMRLGFPGLRVRVSRYGVLRAQVIPGSMAERQGIETGDEIRAIGDTWVSTPAAFYNVAKANGSGAMVPVRFHTEEDVRIVPLQVQWTDYYTAESLRDECGE